MCLSGGRELNFLNFFFWVCWGFGIFTIAIWRRVVNNGVSRMLDTATSC